MTDRRSLLKMILGAGVAAPVVSPAMAAEALGVPLIATATGRTAQDLMVEQVGPGPREYPFGLNPWRLRQKIDRQRQPATHMPPHISTKRSWSPAYKAGEFAREQMIVDAYIDRILGDQDFALRVARALGIAE